MRVAKVKSLSTSSEAIVPFTSVVKPDISKEIIIKWQQIVDLAANIMGVPSGLITRLNEKDLEVFLTNKDEKNIFNMNDKLELGAGWYCESVAAQRKELVLPNALEVDEWKENPSIPFNIISYMGIPISWPDGEVFGTFCMLDSKENQYSKQYRDLLNSLREIIQEDLKSVLVYQKTQKELANKDYQIREVHHRVKNHFALLLSTLNLQSFIGAHESSGEILSEIQSRIYAISSIHDKLYRSSNLEEVDLGDYLTELGRFVINNLAKDDVYYNCTSDKFSGSTNISLPCGLLLNELLTNSLKYAFDGIETPKIQLSICIENGNIHFDYRDNGHGLSNNFDIEKSESLGMILIKQLVLQLDGFYEIYNDDGFVFETSFPY